MKKLLLVFVVCCLCILQTAFAIPAKPCPIVVTQPDGSQITIQLYGDEFFSYKTSIDGYQIQQLEDGFYYYYTPAMATTRSVKEAASVRVNDPQDRSDAERKFLATINSGVNSEYYEGAKLIEKEKRAFLNENFVGLKHQTHAIGTKTNFAPKGLVILAEFKDVKFQSNHGVNEYDALLNERGYSKEGAIGCGREYFEASSQGRYSPEFVVAAKVTLDQDLAYYGGMQGKEHDARPAQMIVDACTAADDQVDFSEFDCDGDGYIDQVFVFFAGYSEAEGASSDAIWPHRWVVHIPGSASGKDMYDGVKLRDYACTAELRGNEGSTTMCGAGVFCHEFGHVLGLPDYYDTDYTGSGGESVGLYNFAIMCSGGYNKDSAVPPLYCGIERVQVGWSTLKDISEVPDGEITIAPWSIDNKNSEIYYIPTECDGEIFMLESRGTEGWDEPLEGSGLIITHWDNKHYDNEKDTYAYKNEQNTVNVDPSHMYVRFIESYGMPIKARNVRLSQVAYPGERKRDAFAAGNYGFMSWGGETLPITLTNIVDDNGTVTFTKEAISNEPVTISNITQNSAKVVFLKAGGNMWSMKYKTENGDWVQRNSIAETSVTLTKLAPNSKYSCVVTNSEDVEYTAEFETMPLTGPTPIISGVKSEYKLNSSYSPEVVNIIDSYNSIEWTVNGSGIDTNGNLTFTSTGKSKIQCKIIYNDGSTEVLTKEVNVK